MKNKVPFKEAALYWLKLGFISFGGPASQISMMHEEVVERKKWIDDKSFFHALNFTMLLPGPEAQQLATYLGWLMHGRIGGFTAGILLFKIGIEWKLIKKIVVLSKCIHILAIHITSMIVGVIHIRMTKKLASILSGAQIIVSNLREP